MKSISKLSFFKELRKELKGLNNKLIGLLNYARKNKRNIRKTINNRTVRRS